MKIMSKIVLLIATLFLFMATKKQDNVIEITGELKQWHKITLKIQGPETSEWAKENPFLNYKLEVTFSNGGKKYKVPGFFAADGNAAESSAEEGNTWKVRFRPDRTGTWQYTISFRHGKNIAVMDGDDLGDPVLLDGVEGHFIVEQTDKKGVDFRGMGRIVNGGQGNYIFQDSEEIWIKNGTDSPENFLAYYEFDQTLRFNLSNILRRGEADPTSNLHRYAPHVDDWKIGNPTWKAGKGKGIIGAINYLHSMGINSSYMLTLNIMGDGNDVWPYTDYNERYRFDCSKLDQWETVFEYMDNLGMMKHFVLQETENECLLDGGKTDVQRRLYLRELIARFGHHLGVIWNIGEENGPIEWSPVGQSHEQKEAMINYLKEENPYPSIVVVHTFGNDKQEEYLTPFLGFKNLDGPSIQFGHPKLLNSQIKKWVVQSKEAGHQWLLNYDECGPAWKGIMPDSFDAKHDTVRHYYLWGALMAGGAGVEWYFGYRYPQNDLNVEDFRSRHNWWKQSTIATKFLNQYPLPTMKNNNDLINVEDAYCLAKPGEIYIVYLPDGKSNPALQLNDNKSYSVKWFNPRDGGELQYGSVSEISGGGSKPLGNPSGDVEKDWVVVVR
jgi:hypothetical protein